jgi:hypothetical protein
MRANMPPVLRATASPAFVASDAGFRCSGAAGSGTAASRLTQLPSLRVPAVGTAIGQVDASLDGRGDASFGAGPGGSSGAGLGGSFGARLGGSIDGSFGAGLGASPGEVRVVTEA